MITKEEEIKITTWHYIVDNKLVCAFRDEQRDGYSIIWSLITPEQHRRKGYAKSMLKEFMDDKQLYVRVKIDNDIAINLYTSLGFTKTDVIPESVYSMDIQADEHIIMVR